MRGVEDGVREEAKSRAVSSEQIRNRMNELLTLAYERAMGCLEDEGWLNDNVRASDLIQIIKLH